MTQDASDNSVDSIPILGYLNYDDWAIYWYGRLSIANLWHFVDPEGKYTPRSTISTIPKYQEMLDEANALRERLFESPEPLEPTKQRDPSTQANRPCPTGRLNLDRATEYELSRQGVLMYDSLSLEKQRYVAGITDLMVLWRVLWRASRPMVPQVRSHRFSELKNIRWDESDTLLTWGTRINSFWIRSAGEVPEDYVLAILRSTLPTTYEVTRRSLQEVQTIFDAYHIILSDADLYKEAVTSCEAAAQIANGRKHGIERADRSRSRQSRRRR